MDSSSIRKQAEYLWTLIWETWDLRIVILISLFLQTFLLFTAPLRKRTANGGIVVPMWLAYTLADNTANFAVGLISKGLADTSSPTSTSPLRYPPLVSFWAPFLLLHLGGPDTITAFALQDNELWLRHVLQLLFQCITIVYVFVLTLPNNPLWKETILVFASGFILYVERIRSLYLATWRKFRDSLLLDPDPGPNYAKHMDQYVSDKDANLRVRIQYSYSIGNRRDQTNEDDGLKDLDLVLKAYNFFQTFKRLMADLIFSFRERDESRNFFLKISARDAFKVVETELYFLYEILYTKAKVVRGRYGFPARFASIFCNLAALVLFYFYNKQGLQKFDVAITYTLLLSPVAFNIVSLIMLLYSDWTAVALYIKAKSKSWFTRLLIKLLNVKRDRWSLGKDDGKCKRILSRKWSESASQFDLIDYCLYPRSKIVEIIADQFGLIIILDRMKYVGPNKITPELEELIFGQLKMKSERAKDIEMAKEICSAKGSWILEDMGCHTLLPFVRKADYDESLILWHIATDLCYYTTTSDDNESQKTKNFRENAKRLSDYMLYLLIMEPNMMSAVAGSGPIRFRDTCAEAKRFFRDRKIGDEKHKKGRWHWEDNKEGRLKDELGKACKEILYIKTAIKPVHVKGDQSKSVLFDACILAKKLGNFKREECKMEECKWEIISKVWVELLSYAACHSRASSHAAHLSKGGQLISVVWLLMAHLGLGDQFQEAGDHPTAVLIREK